MKDPVDPQSNGDEVLIQNTLRIQREKNLRLRHEVAMVEKHVRTTAFPMTTAQNSCHRIRRHFGEENAMKEVAGEFKKISCDSLAKDELSSSLPLLVIQF